MNLSLYHCYAPPLLSPLTVVQFLFVLSVFLKVLEFECREVVEADFSNLMQVPIQVNKYLAYNDGMRVVEPAKMVSQPPLSDGLLFTNLDRYHQN
uniref:Uncharacterized protein n=1 Tax=Nelumbo nucifera TaxID=4432 RepID=A0A822Z8A4_NELNU|nr:TPA_asm: hypothetical protein HUJ06_015116 [Nelumbo nucifera]